MKHGTKYQSKQEKVFSTWFLVMSLRKILETFIRFFPSSFNRKYVHTVACTVVFVGPAHFVFNAYPGRNATCPLSSCSNKNDGPRGRFNCISTVSCKGSVCVEVLPSFYCRFFFEEGQLSTHPPHRPSTEAAIFFIYWLRLALARWIFRKSTILPETVSVWSA